jgi:hypothetical protein
MCGEDRELFLAVGGVYRGLQGSEPAKVEAIPGLGSGQLTSYFLHPGKFSQRQEAYFFIDLCISHYDRLPVHRQDTLHSTLVTHRHGCCAPRKEGQPPAPTDPAQPPQNGTSALLVQT